MTIKQQGGIFGRNPTFNDVDATDITSSTVTATNITSSTVSATTSVSTPVETISGNTSAVSFASNSAGMLFSGGTDVTKYSGIVFRGGNSWNTFLGRIPDASFDPLVIGNDAISAFGAMCTFGYSDVTINRGNLVIGTSGKGIDFSATSGTGTSELFSDYEEGTYTASLYGNTTGAGTPLPIRSDYNTLAYTKIGRQVTITGKLETSGSHSASGYLRLTVPFVGADLSDSAGTATGSVFFYRTGQLHTNPSVITGEGTSTVIFYENTAGGDVTTINAEDMDAAIEVFFGFTYFAT